MWLVKKNCWDVVLLRFDSIIGEYVGLLDLYDMDNIIWVALRWNGFMPGTGNTSEQKHGQQERLLSLIQLSQGIYKKESLVLAKHTQKVALAYVLQEFQETNLFATTSGSPPPPSPIHISSKYHHPLSVGGQGFPTNSITPLLLRSYPSTVSCWEMRYHSKTRKNS